MSKPSEANPAYVTVDEDALIISDPADDDGKPGKPQLRLSLHTKLLNELGLTIAMLEQINEETQQRLNLATQELLEKRGQLNALLAGQE